MAGKVGGGLHVARRGRQIAGRGRATAPNATSMRTPLISAGIHMLVQSRSRALSTTHGNDGFYVYALEHSYRLTGYSPIIYMYTTNRFCAASEASRGRQR